MSWRNIPALDGNVHIVLMLLLDRMVSMGYALEERDQCCNRCTGETGENARRAYFEYKNNGAKSKIQVVVEQVSRCMPRSPVRIVNNTSRSVTTPVNPAAPTFVRPAIIYVCIN